MLSNKNVVYCPKSAHAEQSDVNKLCMHEQRIKSISYKANLVEVQRRIACWIVQRVPRYIYRKNLFGTRLDMRSFPFLGIQLKEQLVRG